MYQVGQILYSIIEDKKIIIPVHVIEEVTVKNLDFEKTSYKVLLPNKKSQKVDLERFDQIFKDIDSASNYLLENAKKAIENISLDALELEDKFFKNKDSELQENNSMVKIESCNQDNKKVKIDLGDGMVASISEDEISKLT